MKVTNGWLSGAVKKPISHNYTKGMWSKYPTWEGIVLHVTASEASSQYGWFNNPNSGASSHFHLAYDGTLEQYVSLNDRSHAQKHGSDRLISIETQGIGSGKWTDKQMAALTELCAFLSKHYGFPLTQMKDSKVSSKGIGYHALGVAKDWAQYNTGKSQTGGELWSSAPGKICPGPNRIKQIPAIVKQESKEKLVVRTPAQAVTWAKERVGKSGYAGLCEMFVRTCYGFGAKYPTAVAAYRASARAGAIHKSYNAPAGVPVFWTLVGVPAGHVALSIGGGRAVSTSDEAGRSRLCIIRIARYQSRWSTYLGWAEVYHGQRVYSSSTGKHKAPKPATTKKSVASGLSVKGVQRQLRATGDYTRAIDGKDGPHLAAAVLAYQDRQKYFPGMKRDGVWGKMTQAHYKWVKKLQKKLNTLASTKRVGKTKVDGDYGAYVGRLVEIAQGATPAYRKKYKLDKIAGPAFCKAIKLAKHPYA